MDPIPESAANPPVANPPVANPSVADAPFADAPLTDAPLAGPPGAASPAVDGTILNAMTVADFNRIGKDRLPGFLGIEILDIGSSRVAARLAIGPHHVAPNGYLHAATVVALADTACGYGCIANLPAGATGFTTVELKSNFVGTLTTGALHCEAEMVHGGRTTQLWDARVSAEGDGRLLALFRCTQILLRPR